MPEPSTFEFELAIDQIPAELIKAGGRSIYYEIHKLIISIRNVEELPEEWKESGFVPVYKKAIVVMTREYNFCQIRRKFYPTSCCHG